MGCDAQKIERQIGMNMALLIERYVTFFAVREGTQVRAAK